MTGGKHVNNSLLTDYEKRSLSEAEGRQGLQARKAENRTPDLVNAIRAGSRLTTVNQFISKNFGDFYETYVKHRKLLVPTKLVHFDF